MVSIILRNSGSETKEFIPIIFEVALGFFFHVEMVEF
jgi:hypothetical protein